VTESDLISATGTRKMNDGNGDFIWAASAVAQHKIKEAFEPLINTVLQRMVYIMKRTLFIVTSALHFNWFKFTNDDGPSSLWEGRSSASFARRAMEEEMSRPIDFKGEGLVVLCVRKEKVQVLDVDNYPYFTNHMRSICERFIESTTMTCKQKCLEELYSAESIYYLYNLEKSTAPASEKAADRSSISFDKVLDVTREIFNTTRERLTRNILNKLYHFYLHQFESGLLDALEGLLNALDDKELETKFQLSHVVQKMDVDIQRLTTENVTWAMNVDLFRKASAELTVPLVHELHFL